MSLTIWETAAPYLSSSGQTLKMHRFMVLVGNFFTFKSSMMFPIKLPCGFSTHPCHAGAGDDFKWWIYGGIFRKHRYLERFGSLDPFGMPSLEGPNRSRHQRCRNPPGVFWGSKMGIPVAVQHLVKDAEVFKDASLQLGTWRCCCTFRMLLRCFHFSSDLGPLVDSQNQGFYMRFRTKMKSMSQLLGWMIKRRRSGAGKFRKFATPAPACKIWCWVRV